MSRVLTLETLTVPASFFGPACEDMALRTEGGASHFPEPRTALARQHRAGAGRDVITPRLPPHPAYLTICAGAGGRILTLTFRRGPVPAGARRRKARGTTHAEQPIAASAATDRGVLSWHEL